MEIMEKIVESVNDEPVTFMQLCRQCGFNYRTVKRCLELIEFIQNGQSKLQISRDGFRVVIKKVQNGPTRLSSF